MPGLDLAPTVSDSAISFAVSGQISVAGIPIAVQGSITLDHLNVKITPAGAELFA